MNCTNSSIVIPGVIPSGSVVPVPPIPTVCNYTCDDILALHVVIQNLTAIVTNQQDDIDMLISQQQALAQRVSKLE
jgi:hypothetical protein